MSTQLNKKKLLLLITVYNIVNILYKYKQQQQ